MADELPELFTIGHSTQTIDEFLSRLHQHGITALADVRSHPYSSYTPHFNREELSQQLVTVGIKYVFLGKELGARREESQCYDGDRAEYHRIAVLPAFRDGLARLRYGAKQFRIALMCAEKEPIDCHRTILICRHIRDKFSIKHIHADGSIERHEDLERRLVQQMGVSRTLFEPNLTDEELILRAYDERALEIAYQLTDEGASA